MQSPPNIYSSFLRHRGTRFRALFALGLVCVFWGTTWIATKFGVSHMPALQLAGIRQFFAGSAYLAYFSMKGKMLPRGKEWLPILILGFLNFVFTNGLTTWGIQFITAGLGAIISSIFPLWLMLIGLFSSEYKVPGKAVWGLLLGFSGICVIFSEHLGDFLNADFRFGIFLSLTASLSWATGTFFTKKAVKNFDPYFSIGIQMFISGIVLYCTAWGSGMTVPVRLIPWQSWAAIFYLVLIGSVLTFAAYLYALQNLPTNLVSTYGYINPVVAVLLGALLFNEKLTLFIAAGGVITLAGVYLVNETFRQRMP